jgi:hypothetical protein
MGTKDQFSFLDRVAAQRVLEHLQQRASSHRPAGTPRSTTPQSSLIPLESNNLGFDRSNSTPS